MRALSEKGYPMEEILAMTEKEQDREKLYKQFGIIQSRKREGVTKVQNLWDALFFCNACGFTSGSV